MECDVKMNKKRKIVIRLVLLVTIMSLFSLNCLTALGKDISIYRDIGKNSNLETASYSTVNVGDIYIDHNGPQVECSPINHPNFFLGAGGNLKIKAGYTINCKTSGLPDGGSVGIKLENSNSFQAKAYSENRKSDTLNFEINNCRPGDVYRITLYAEYTWAVDAWGNSETETDEEISTITIKIPEGNLDVYYPGTLHQVEGHDRGDGCSGSFFIRNNGESGSDFDWTTSIIENPDDASLSYSPKRGTDQKTGRQNDVEICVSYKFPDYYIGKGAKFRWTILVQNIDNPSQNVEVPVVFTTGTKSKFQPMSNSNLFLQRILSSNQFSFLSDLLDMPLFSTL